MKFFVGFAYVLLWVFIGIPLLCAVAILLAALGILALGVFV